MNQGKLSEWATRQPRHEIERRLIKVRGMIRDLPTTIPYNMAGGQKRWLATLERLVAVRDAYKAALKVMK